MESTHTHTEEAFTTYTQEIWHIWEKAKLLGGTMWTVLPCAVAQEMMLTCLWKPVQKLQIYLFTMNIIVF